MSDTRPILVTFARPEESRGFRRRLLPTQLPGRLRPGRFKAFRGRVGAIEILGIHTGIGPEAAAAAMECHLAAAEPWLVLCAGFGGALDPALGAGDVVMEERCPTPPERPRIVSRPLPAESVEAKAALYRETGARVVDMETEALATACEREGVSMVAVRAVSDSATEPLPVPFPVWFDSARQRPRPMALLAWLATHPSQIGPFARFVRRLAGVSAALALAVETVIVGTTNH